jgi:hypothetical protein
MHPDWEPDKLATAAIFYNLHEADIAKGLLESCAMSTCTAFIRLPVKLLAACGCRLRNRMLSWQKSCSKNMYRRKILQALGR